MPLPRPLPVIQPDDGETGPTARTVEFVLKNTDMKKIMFNDHYGLTQAVLEGRKTMTRRLVNMTQHEYELVRGLYPTAPTALIESIMADKTRYSIGEIVAVAQDYSHCGGVMSNGVPRLEYISKVVGSSSAGWRNKMFVRADLMPHQIRITGIRIERLQDISDDDCLREGIQFHHKSQSYYVDYRKQTGYRAWLGSTPREVFAALIDKVSGRGTWKSNPWVFVYEFELVR